MSAETFATADYDVVPSRAARHRRAGGQPWWTPILVIAAVTAVAGGLRFTRLSFPHQYVFDEIYYAKDGCFDAGFPWQRCHLQGPGEQTSTVHPPLGRWIIAGSEAAFGNDSFGWRFASAVAGTLSVTFLTILAWRLFGSILWGGISGVLLATENLNFVQSRMSMLDIFVTAFVVLGFLFLVLDREWVERRTPQPVVAGERDEIPLPPDRAPSPILRPWRVATGIALGAAAATKWSGALAVLAAIALSIMWERTRRRRLAIRRPLLDAVRDEGFAIFVFLFLVPVAVYLASYLRFWIDNGLDGQALSSWWKNQQGMASYSIHLRATHPYASKAWTWLLLKRPVAYYYVCHRMSGAVCARPAEILAVGNPLIFWASVFTIPWLVWRWSSKRDWRAGFIVVAILVQYLPWFAAARTSFLFYMAPITPFMVLAFAYVARDVADVRFEGRRSGLTVGIASFLIATSIAMFVWFYPVLTGGTLTYDQWRYRMWYGRCSPKPTWCWI
jgi:dolichyl-phosphate-mannose-protein mannosyltransferase